MSHDNDPNVYDVQIDAFRRVYRNGLLLGTMDETEVRQMDLRRDRGHILPQQVQVRITPTDGHGYMPNQRISRV